MKKIVVIIAVLFSVSTILQNVLTIVVNEQILSRVLFGVDYDTYLTNYYSGQNRLIDLISGSKMPYEWLFTLSKYMITILCIIITFLVIKEFKQKYTITKKEFVIIMSVFSILSLYDVILYIVMFQYIPPFKFFIIPCLFIFVVYMCIYKMMYLNNNK